MRTNYGGMGGVSKEPLMRAAGVRLASLSLGQDSSLRAMRKQRKVLTRGWDEQGYVVGRSLWQDCEEIGRKKAGGNGTMWRVLKLLRKW